MIVLKYLVVATAALVSRCYEEIGISQCLERGTDKRMLGILTALDEKIGRVQTVVVTSEFLSKCIAALENQDFTASSNFYKEWLTQATAIDRTTTEFQILRQLIKAYHSRKQERLPIIAKFIGKNVEKGSELAIDCC